MPGNFHTVPASIIETWPPPNYIDPIRRGWMPALAGTLMAVATVLVWTRLYLRKRGDIGSFGLDDLFIFIGWAVSIPLSVGAIIDVLQYGLDVHTWDVRPTDYVGAALIGWIAQILFLMSSCATKLSVLLFYRRLMKDISPLWLYAIWAALTFTASYFVSVFITYCFLCTPLDAYWKSYDVTYKENFTCLNGTVLSPFIGGLSVFSDLYAVGLPWAFLRHYDLNIPRRQKIGLNIAFGLGLIVAGCGCARTYYLWQIDHDYDTSWVGFSLYVWSLLECDLAIIIACVPALRALLRRYMGSNFTSTFLAGRSGASGSGYLPTNGGKNEWFPTKDSQSSRAAGVRSPVSDWSGGTQSYAGRWSKGNHTHIESLSHNRTSSSTPLRKLSSPNAFARATSPVTQPIRNPEDFEAYNMSQIRRYKSQRGSRESLPDSATRYKSQGSYGDPTVGTIPEYEIHPEGMGFIESTTTELVARHEPLRAYGNSDIGGSTQYAQEYPVRRDYADTNFATRPGYGTRYPSQRSYGQSDIARTPDSGSQNSMV